MKKTVLIIVTFIFYLNVTAQNVGIGTTTPAQKLDVVGNLKVSGAIMPGGTSGTNGQVLTSNGAGVAPTWESVAYSGGGRFWIIPTNNARTTGGFTGRGGFIVDGAANQTSQEDSLDFGSTNETGTDFTISNPGLVNNFVIANRTGLYHFEGVIRYFTTSVLSVNMLPRATLFFSANQPAAPNLDILLLEDPMDKTGGSETSNSTNAYNYTAKFHFNIHLEANTTFTFITGFNLLRYPGAQDLIALGVSSNGYISGHFISE